VTEANSLISEWKHLAEFVQSSSMAEGNIVLIIWGIRSVRRNMGAVLAMCHRCSQPCAQSLFDIRRWFTLFFIPLFPVGRSYYSVCSMCAASTRITEEVAHQLQHEGSRQRSRPVEMTPDGPLSPLGIGDPPARQVEATPTTPALDANQHLDASCRSCGTPTDPSDAFCQECGANRLSASSGNV